MKILYGINGTGNGHITKSLQIIQNLEELGHKVDILISGNNTNVELNRSYIQKKGFTFVYEASKINFAKTIIHSSPIKFLKDLNLPLDEWDKIITDFEPITAWTCKLQGKKAIGISHQYSFESKKIPRPKEKNNLSQFFLQYFAPCAQTIGLHFQEYDDFILMPIIRKQIELGKKTNQGGVLVYLPQHSCESMKEKFIKFDYKFDIFTNVKSKTIYKNLTFHPLSIDNFTFSLLNCDTLITAGGFETPAEAMLCGKKLIIIPIKHQYEQLCNSVALSEMGVRVEKNLEDIKSLHASKIDWTWNNPLEKIIDKIIH